MKNYENKYIIRAGVVAAIYFVLTVALKPVSYGVVQFRLSEAMTILPFYMTEAIPGLFLGCVLANVFGGFGLIDIVFGSLTTLIAAFITSKMPNKYLAVVPPILLNAFIVPIWVSKASNTPYIVTAGTIGFGEFISAGIVGIILSTVFERITNLYKR